MRFGESLSRRRAMHRLRLILASLAAALLAAAAGAASIDAGQALYLRYCVGCHGTPPNDMKINNLIAANRPDLIRQQTLINPAMQFLAPLADADLTNIATYIAYPVTTDADCLLGWGETILPSLLTPRRYALSCLISSLDFLAIERGSLEFIAQRRSERPAGPGACLDAIHVPLYERA